MVEHVVLFKFKEETTKDQLIEVCEKFKSLKDKVPGLIDAQAGLNFSINNKGFQVLLSAKLDDIEALDFYLSHPAHQEVASLSREVGRLDSIVMDIKV
jgi:ABC-type glycerol-3-phosphate transport system substrate-binding protein